MADDQRVYSDEEFALILKQAADLASQAEQTGGAAPSSGLSLAEMKSAAAQAGFDPALVERAARMMEEMVHESPLERLIGGPMRLKQDVRLPVVLDENRAALLLSAVRISGALAGSKDDGHSSEIGMTWHDGGPLESLGVTARPEKTGTSVSLSIDRRGHLATVGAFSAMALFMALLFSMFALYPEGRVYGIAGAIASVGGVFAIARGYWASSTRRMRERIGTVIDSINQTLERPEAESPRKLEPPETE